MALQLEDSERLFGKCFRGGRRSMCDGLHLAELIERLYVIPLRVNTICMLLAVEGYILKEYERKEKPFILPFTLLS